MIVKEENICNCVVDSFTCECNKLRCTRSLVQDVVDNATIPVLMNVVLAFAQSRDLVLRTTDVEAAGVLEPQPDFVRRRRSQPGRIRRYCKPSPAAHVQLVRNTPI